MKNLVLLLLTCASVFGQLRPMGYDFITRNVTPTDLDYVGVTGNFTTALQRNGVNVVDAALTLTMTGTANEITLSAGAQSLAANRTWTFSLPTALTFTGKTITGGTYSSPTLTAPQINSIELNHASANTLSAGSGFATIEGKPIASPLNAVAGDTMYFDGTQWVRLAKGTAGQVLEMNAGATAPEWDTDDSGGAGSQTPWTSTINADGNSLTNVASIVGTGSGTTVIENTAGLNITNTPVTIEDPLTIVGTIELGHASDSTLSRGAAGFLAVEGKRISSPASAVAGDVQYFDGTEWVRLAKGTAGQVLEMNAGATAPEWDTDDTAAGGESAGTVHGSGTPIANAVTLYADTTGTNIIPSTITVSSLTNLNTGSLVVSNANRQITVAGVAHTFPTTASTVARTDAANTFAGIQTFSSAPVLSSTTASQALVVDSGKALSSVAYTGAGNVMRTRTGVQRSIWIPAGAMTPSNTNGAATATISLGTSTNYVTRDVFDFDDTTPERTEFTIVFPHAWDLGTLSYKVYFYSGATTGTAEFGLAAKSVADNESNDVAWGTMINVSKAVSGTANRLNITATSAAVTVATTPALNEAVNFVLWRVTTDTAVDTLTGDARVRGVMLFYLETTTEPSAP